MINRFVCMLTFSVICCLSWLVNANDNIQQLTAINGDFLQSKNIKALKRPFNSTGSFVYLPQNGLLWQTLTPIASVKLFAKNGVFKLDKQGKMQKEAHLDNDFFLALFSADQAQLLKYFSIVKADNVAQKNQTCLTLTPRSDTLHSLFNSINLCSANEATEQNKIPEKITLVEPNGNTTEINLTQSVTKVSELELSYFN